MNIVKTSEQLERKFRKVYKRMKLLNDPKRYEGRELTQKETIDLYEAIGEWKTLCWITGKYTI